jgi:zinc protease
VESGLFQNLAVRHDTRNYTGSFDIMATTTTDKTLAAAAALSAEMKHLAAPDFFEEDDMALARKRITVMSALLAESADDVAHSIATTWSSAGLRYYRDYHSAIASRSAADVRGFVDEYIRGKPVAVTILLSPASQQRIGAPLNAVLNSWGKQ